MLPGSAASFHFRSSPRFASSSHSRSSPGIAYPPGPTSRQLLIASGNPLPADGPTPVHIPVSPDTVGHPAPAVAPTIQQDLNRKNGQTSLHPLPKTENSPTSPPRGPRQGHLSPRRDADHISTPVSPPLSPISLPPLFLSSSPSVRRDTTSLPPPPTPRQP